MTNIRHHHYHYIKRFILHIHRNHETAALSHNHFNQCLKRYFKTYQLQPIFPSSIYRISSLLYLQKSVFQRCDRGGYLHQSQSHPHRSFAIQTKSSHTISQLLFNSITIIDADPHIHYNSGIDIWGYDSILSLGAWETAKGMYLRHEEIVEKLNQSEQRLDIETMTRLSKEMHSLVSAASLVKQIEDKRKELSDLQLLIDESKKNISFHSSSSTQNSQLFLNDAHSILSLAQSDYSLLPNQLKELENVLLDHLLPGAEDIHRNAILEVRAGTGGDEASLFAKDLFMMYQHFTELKGWKWEILSVYQSEAGGYKEATSIITGQGVFGSLKYESGVHRVQRVPLTETNGRIHTSAATVAILPEVEDIDVVIKDSDIRVDVYRSGGKGGQHVNTTDSAVRITHIPTGIVVAIQDERSQISNKTKALRILRSRIYEEKRKVLESARVAMRAEQVGTGDRSERIRTYNYGQDRISDHRINLTKHDIDKMMSGELLDLFINQLKHQERLKQLQQINGGE